VKVILLLFEVTSPALAGSYNKTFCNVQVDFNTWPQNTGKPILVTCPARDNYFWFTKLQTCKQFYWKWFAVVRHAHFANVLWPCVEIYLQVGELLHVSSTLLTQDIRPIGTTNSYSENATLSPPLLLGSTTVTICILLTGSAIGTAHFYILDCTFCFLDCTKLVGLHA